MRAAIAEALKGKGTADPNPMVGAVIVEDGRIVARGYHARAGEPHAEVNVLKNLGRAPKADAVMYITLEPCCTHGRTPPCTDAILHSGLQRVVVGAIDPNPKHQGRGLEILRNAGIDVRQGLLEDECETINRSV